MYVIPHHTKVTKIDFSTIMDYKNGRVSALKLHWTPKDAPWYRFEALGVKCWLSDQPANVSSGIQIHFNKMIQIKTTHLHPWLFFHEWSAVDRDRDRHVPRIDSHGSALVVRIATRRRWRRGWSRRRLGRRWFDGRRGRSDGRKAPTIGLNTQKRDYSPIDHAILGFEYI